MNYDVCVSYGHDSREYIQVKNVDLIVSSESLVSFTDKQGGVLLAVPEDKLVYALKVTE